MLLQLQRVLIERLEQFLRALEEDFAEFGGAFVREEAHSSTSISLVCRAVVQVDHAELIAQSEQAFGMADEEISIGIQAAIELFDEPLLLGLVEIDHHVAAEDEVVALGQELGLQVVEVELDHLLTAGLIV